MGIHVKSFWGAIDQSDAQGNNAALSDIDTEIRDWLLAIHRTENSEKIADIHMSSASSNGVVMVTVIATLQ